ncbi:MAG: SDR family NAD(P)-dependent oxidoreductase [Methylibium sp.]|uniref:SDR family NAD(P)-dependent oxidoreductase n=1 Tax=Methylibium sp. TaxID=2067992 RepID=UPI0017B7EF2D|nr:SDR family NAD(P)-dependent oxidoreductase [Methylibium sp.]
MNTTPSTRPLAVVTGASTGIGFELAKCCAENGFDLLIAADEPQIDDAAGRLRASGTAVEAVQADLATSEGVGKLYAAIRNRPVEALLANAGRGLGKGFLEQDFDAVKRVIDTNITGTIELLHKVARDMRSRGRGRILITGSIAGFMPGSYQAAYNGSKAFLDSFSFALRNELEDSGVTVTCLMPGATDTDFFERADMLDTKVGTMKKDDPAMVAKLGFEAMMKGSGDVVTGLKNKLQVAMAHVTPAPVLAKMHRKQAAPGTAHKPPKLTGTNADVAAGAIGGLAGGTAVSTLLLLTEAAGVDNASDMVRMQRRGAARLGMAHRPVGAAGTLAEEAIGHTGHMALSVALGAAYGASFKKSSLPPAVSGAAFGIAFFPIAYGVVGPLLGLTRNPAHERSMTMVRRAVVHGVFGIVTALVADRAARRLHAKARDKAAVRQAPSEHNAHGLDSQGPSANVTTAEPVAAWPGANSVPTSVPALLR